MHSTLYANFCYHDIAKTVGDFWRKKHLLLCHCIFLKKSKKKGSYAITSKYVTSAS